MFPFLHICMLASVMWVVAAFSWVKAIVTARTNTTAIYTNQVHQKQILLATHNFVLFIFIFLLSYYFALFPIKLDNCPQSSFRHIYSTCNERWVRTHTHTYSEKKESELSEAQFTYWNEWIYRHFMSHWQSTNEYRSK